MSETPKKKKKKKVAKGGDRGLATKPRSVRDLVTAARAWCMEDESFAFLEEIDFSALPEYAGNGRRSAYHPTFCLVALYLGYQGFTRKEIAAAIKQGYQTLLNWQDQHPEFLDAMKEADNLREAYFAGRLRLTSAGLLKGNMTGIKFALKNINPDDWKDKHEFEGRTEVAKDVKDLTPEEVDRMDSDMKRRLMKALDSEESEDDA